MRRLFGVLIKFLYIHYKKIIYNKKKNNTIIEGSVILWVIIQLNSYSMKV